MKLCLGAILFACVAGIAHAEDIAPLTGKEVVLRSRPNLAKFYPYGASASHTQGAASVICVVSEKGELTDCAVQSEAPAGQGFGDAVKKAASRIRLEPQAKDGTSTAGRKFLFEMTFVLPRG